MIQPLAANTAHWQLSRSAGWPPAPCVRACVRACVRVACVIPGYARVRVCIFAAAEPFSALQPYVASPHQPQSTIIPNTTAAMTAVIACGALPLPPKGSKGDTPPAPSGLRCRVAGVGESAGWVDEEQSLVCCEFPEVR
jgi:hypothetical protein